MTVKRGDNDTRDILRNSGQVSGLPRRDFLAGLATAAAGALLPLKDSMAQAPKNGGRWIDWHHHFGPPQWRSFLESRGSQATTPPRRAAAAITAAGGYTYGPGWGDWTPAEGVEQLDKANAATAMVSITTPGIWLGENVATMDATRGLARECNEYGAKMKMDYPGRFGLWAVLPLPDVDGSLREIEYAFDTLKADGVGLLTSYGDKWLGDPSFSPMWEELNRRKAIVFTHPDVPFCCRGTQGHGGLVPGVGNNLIEYGTDTTRTILSLIVSKVGEKYPDIKFSFSHGGGEMPFLIGRIVGRENLASLTDPSKPNARLEQLRKFYYDTANVNNLVSLDALRKVVGVSQIMVGTDFPYEGNVGDRMANLRDSGVFNAKELHMIGRENPERLVPRLKTDSV